MKFEYLQARTVEEAAGLLVEYGDKAKLIAGGTDLVVQLRRNMIRSEYVIDIKGIRDMDYLKYDHGMLSIGALATIESLKRSEDIKRNHPLIAEAAGQLASVGVRNLATLGGNLCNASPSADMAPSLIGLGAKVRIAGVKGQTREISLEDFFQGPGTTTLRRGEVLIEVKVPRMEERTIGAYLKHGIRGSIDLAIVGVAVCLRLGSGKKCHEARIVLGAVAPTPIRARKAEQMLKDKQVTEGLLVDCGRMASEEAHPISDVRATAEYRKQMVQVFTRNAIKEVLDRSA
jgi:carbon-monoxide dehydrogenase medium subunit